MLKAYCWPGNVRELQNVIERALIQSSGGKLDLSQAIPRGAGSAEAEVLAVGSRASQPDRVLNCNELEEFERRNLVRALESCGWKISGEKGVAALLGLPPSTVSSRIKALGIQRL